MIIADDPIVSSLRSEITMGPTKNVNIFVYFSIFP